MLKNATGALSISIITGCGKVTEASLSSDLAKALKCTLNFKYLTNPADVNRTTCMLKCFAELEVNEFKNLVMEEAARTATWMPVIRCVFFAGPWKPFSFFLYSYNGSANFI